MQVYWIWLSKLTGLNFRQKYDLYCYYGSPKAVFEAGLEVGYHFSGLSEKGLKALGRQDLTEAYEIIRNCQRLGVRILTWSDEAYSMFLAGIDDPPFVLYVLGTIPQWNKLPCVGIVGTRRASPYGLQMARRIGAEVAAGGGVVVSGCADGVDTASMAAAMEQGMPVLGVLGCGIDVVYPAKNRAFFKEVIARGCLISEYEPGLSPLPYRFVARNRLINGFSQATVVVEAPEKSGALITARHAVEQHRLLYAVPGSVNNPVCAGSNDLLRHGARVAFCGGDVLKAVLESYNQLSPIVLDKKPIDKPENTHYIGKENKLPALKPDEQLVYEKLTEKGVLIDSLVGVGGMDITRALVAISGLECKRLAERCPGSKVRLK